ncbi:GH14678 [Drosophila grimshawi]|uniref:GH14678 n=1 Tax=Drosophila grimshawi TaxID=7222 RepID=B4IXL8_DROGR|nr:GH14678 [Drosophila grimshawi]
MFQHKNLIRLLCLLFLAGGLHTSQAEEFPQCANVEADTFVMAIDDCVSYIYCNGENSFRDSCPDQTYFDAKAQECTFDDAGVCLEPMSTTTAQPATVVAMTVDSSNGSDELQPGAPTTSTPASIVAQPSASDGSRPHCDTMGDGYHPHPQRCEYYYSCIDGYLTIVRCPYKYGWDYAQQQCKPLSEVRCFSL